MESCKIEGCSNAIKCYCECKPSDKYCFIHIIKHLETFMEESASIKAQHKKKSIDDHTESKESFNFSASIEEIRENLYERNQGLKRSTIDEAIPEEKKVQENLKEPISHDAHAQLIEIKDMIKTGNLFIQNLTQQNHEIIVNLTTEINSLKFELEKIKIENNKEKTINDDFTEASNKIFKLEMNDAENTLDNARIISENKTQEKTQNKGKIKVFCDRNLSVQENYEIINAELAKIEKYNSNLIEKMNDFKTEISNQLQEAATRIGSETMLNFSTQMNNILMLIEKGNLETNAKFSNLEEQVSSQFSEFDAKLKDFKSLMAIVIKNVRSESESMRNILFDPSDILSMKLNNMAQSGPKIKVDQIDLDTEIQISNELSEHDLKIFTEEMNVLDQKIERLMREIEKTLIDTTDHLNFSIIDLTENCTAILKKYPQRLEELTFCNVFLAVIKYLKEIKAIQFVKCFKRSTQDSLLFVCDFKIDCKKK